MIPTHHYRFYKYNEVGGVEIFTQHPDLIRICNLMELIKINIEEFELAIKDRKYREMIRILTDDQE
jgi:hypothetical protein